MVEKNRGFTLVELMITMVIMGVVIALTGPLYTRLLTGVKEETVSSGINKDIVNSLELIRLDLEHTGYGVARDETSLPITWDETNKILELRSTLNNTNQTTMGWALLDCQAASAAIVESSTYLVNRKEISGLQSMVLLDKDKNFAKLTDSSSYTCPAIPGVYTAYPYVAGSTNSCTTGWCTLITYKLSDVKGTPQSRASCAQGTYDFLRAVGSATGGDPIINCVADFRVRFDTSASTEQSVLPTAATAGVLMPEVKNIEIVLLVQAGQKDPDLNTNPNTTVSGVTLSLAGVTDPQNYRWKVLKISGKPMSW